MKDHQHGPRPKNVAQAHNVGFGATEADLNRGHLKVNQPDLYGDSHPQRRGAVEKGFLHRLAVSAER